MDTDLSPLDLIRQTEAEGAHHIAEAHEAAKEKLRQAQIKAAESKRKALDAGRREGEDDFKQAVDKAKLEAAQILVEARQQAEELSEIGDERIEKVVSRAVMIVTGQREEDELP